METNSFLQASKLTDRGLKCFLSTLLVTVFAWNASPFLTPWLFKLCSAEGFAALAAVVLCAALWRPFEQTIATLFRRKFLILPLVLATCAVASSVAWLPLIVKICIGALCMIPIGFCGLWPLMQPTNDNAYPSPPPEQLRRYPLIRGLMQAVMSGPNDSPDGSTSTTIPRIDSRINRIALTGPWGCGKTLILDHVAYGLEQQGLARAVKVSPWGCSTIAEARACLAAGMRALLEEHGLQEIPILKMMAKALGATDAVESIFNEVAGPRTHGLKELDRLLGRREQLTKRRMIMVIDDMERSEPKIILALLPLLSELIELRHCTFLVAIDEEHFRQAFAETDRFEGSAGITVSATTQDHSAKANVAAGASQMAADGFIKKVFDFSIELPSFVPRDRLAAMGRIRLGITEPGDELDQPNKLTKFEPISYDFPKLKAVFPYLLDYLPENPRDLERFLDKARLFDACFLSNYTENETDWQQFFHLYLLDTRFPGVAKAISRAAPSFVVRLNYQPNLGGNIADELKQGGLLSANLPGFKDAMSQFLKSRDSLFSDFSWLTGGFLTPPSLTAKLREVLFETWREVGPCSLTTLVKQAFNGRESPEILGAAGDLLLHCRSYPFEILRRIDELPETQAESVSGKQVVTEHFERLTKWISFWQSDKNDEEILRAIVTTHTIRDWLHLANLINLRKFGQQLATAAATITRTLLECTTVKVRWDIYHDPKSLTHTASTTEATPLTNSIIKICWDDVRSQVWEAIESGAIPSIWPFQRKDACDPLLAPTIYFPEESPERYELFRSMNNPPELLASGLECVWRKLAQWLPHWSSENGRDFDQSSDYWLRLWQAFQDSGNSHVDSVRQAILTADKLPDGLIAVRNLCLEFKKG